jgi:hypothetical protein
VEGLHTYTKGQVQLQQDLSLKFSGKWVSLLGEVSDEDVGVVESDDELDGAGVGSSEEAMEEADEKDKGMSDEEFTCND